MKKTVDYKKVAVDILFIIIGSMMVSFAITSILRPSGLITGGITGISIILDEIFNINYTYIYYVLSILVLLSTFLLLGKREGMKIILLSVLLPIILILFENMGINFVEDDLLLSSIYYGAFVGAGAGLILKRGYSQGGSDTIAKILHHKLFPFISISQILLVIDLSIVAASTFIFERNIALYAILTQVVAMKAVNVVLFGLASKKVKIEIISEEHLKIADYIINNVKRGISSFGVMGGYTNSSKVKLVSVCSPRESIVIKQFISEVDPNAFIDVLPVVSVWGKGNGFESLVENQ